MTQNPSRGPGRPKADPEVRAARNRRAAQRVREEDAQYDPTNLLMARLYDEPIPASTPNEYRHDYFYCRHSANPLHQRLVGLWLAHRDVLLEAWALELPGTRPTVWWWFDAPLIAEIPPGWGGWVLRQWRELRVQLGGTGKAYCPHLNAHLGLPTHWLARDFDAANPPTFESQAAYLKRLGLLFRGEALRLTAKDFHPQRLPTEFWPKRSSP